MTGIGLRERTDDDEPFLFAVYASTRVDELVATGWSDQQKLAFVTQQFHAQDIAYRENYPAASFSIVTLDGAPIGRLYVTRLDDDGLRIIDVALLPEHRNGGIGSQLIGTIMGDAERDRLTVSLHVELWNPAAVLYERLGFRRASANEVYVRMEWTPSPLDVS